MLGYNVFFTEITSPFEAVHNNIPLNLNQRKPVSNFQQLANRNMWFSDRRGAKEK
jgi:hypothetical protein